MAWKKITLRIDGSEIDAVAPTIISASRSTDIPAFHSEWFMNRLREGYVKWINPFNRRAQYISLRETRFIVFWTKNAAPLMRYFPEIDRLGIAYYFNYTVNDYENERLEPNLPPLAERIETFKLLSDTIGKERVIWRFDPLILTNNISVESLCSKIEDVGDKIFTHTNKLVFSYADIDCYKNVKRNLAKLRVDYVQFDRASMLSMASRIHDLNSRWKLELASCSEEIDLDSFGISHNKCVDGNLIRKICAAARVVIPLHNDNLPTQLAMFHKIRNSNLDSKDRGQRKSCLCVESKDIGQYNTCGHLCAYCYANYSPTVVEDNLRKINVHSDCIL